MNLPRAPNLTPPPRAHDVSVVTVASLAEPSIGLTGVLNVHKERGWTSHDVVSRIRRFSGQRRVGHAGTLDPLAEGVLAVLLGRATRLASFVQEGRKVYLATVQLGMGTATDDAEGQPVEQLSVPPLSSALVEEVLNRFRGPIQQVPPAYSAVKVAGQRAYAVARRGDAVTLQPRLVTIYALELCAVPDTDVLDLRVECSSGTYIRSLARDVARALGTAGHLTRLVRTRVGPFALDDALRLEEIGARGVPACLQPPDACLAALPRVCPSEGEIARLLQGQPVPTSAEGDPIRVYDSIGRMLMVGRAADGLLYPHIALVDPEAFT